MSIFLIFLFIRLRLFFSAHQLELFDVDELSTHGGSLRIYAKHKEDTTRSVSDNVAALENEEIRREMIDLNYYKSFQEQVNCVKNDLLSFLIEQKRHGKTVAAYGAAAKGNTLLNYCGIKKDLIRFVVDASPYKQGKYLPGSHIPVFSKEKIREARPDIIVILPWNIKDEIMGQIGYIREWGGKFVLPIPILEVII